MALSSNTRCNGFWYEEQVTEELLLKMAFKKVLFDSESEFQRVQIIESVPFGKTLILDDHTQVLCQLSGKCACVLPWGPSCALTAAEVRARVACST
jgi:hypothetical protein